MEESTRREGMGIYLIGKRWKRLGGREKGVVIGRGRDIGMMVVIEISIVMVGMGIVGGRTNGEEAAGRRRLNDGKCSAYWGKNATTTTCLNTTHGEINN